jgi:cell division cycle 20-like protein 1, cofactor of APC complex
MLKSTLIGDSSFKFNSEKKMNIQEQHSQKNYRKIIQDPYKVLDAPGLQDDYYLNLLDWSEDNCIGVGLDREVYTWSASNNKVMKLWEMEEGDGVCSVSWGRVGGSALGVGDSRGGVRMFDVTKGKVVREFEGHSARVG